MQTEKPRDGITTREIAVLPDGRFAVADAQAEEVRLFGPGGQHLRTFGGEGEGPGELRGTQGVHVHGGMLRVAEQGNAGLAETVRLPFRVDRWVPPVVQGDTVWAVVTDEIDVQYVVRAQSHPPNHPIQRQR